MAQSSNSTSTLAEYLSTTKPDIGWVAGLAPLTGWILWIALLTMIITSLPFIRRTGHFEVIASKFSFQAINYILIFRIF